MDESKVGDAPLRDYLSGILKEEWRELERSPLGGGWSRETERWTVRTARKEVHLIAKIEAMNPLFHSPIQDEATWATLAASSGVPAPQIIATEPDGVASVVQGRPFLVLSEVHGRAFDPWAPGAPTPIVPEEERQEIGAEFLQVLSQIHRVPAVVNDATIHDRLTRWTHVGESLSSPPRVLQAVAAWLEQEGPPPVEISEAALVHGDYRIDNCIVHDRRIAGVLDWEFAGYGDRHEDVAWALIPYIGGRFAGRRGHLASHLLPPDEFLSTYEAMNRCTLDRDKLRYYMVLGLFKLLTILHTAIEYFISGVERSPAYASLIAIAPELYKEIAELWRGELLST